MARIDGKAVELWRLQRQLKELRERRGVIGECAVAMPGWMPGGYVTPLFIKQSEGCVIGADGTKEPIQEWMIRKQIERLEAAAAKGSNQ